MKKISIITIICLIMAGCSTIKLAVNTTDEEGRKIYFTSEEFLFSIDDYSVLLSVGVRLGAKDTLCAVMITSTKESDHGIIKKGDNITFKLYDGSSVSAANVLDKGYSTESDKITYAANPNASIIVAYNPFSYLYGSNYVFRDPNLFNNNIQRPSTISSSFTYSYGLYLITLDDMSRIINVGVSDFTIRMDDQDVEMPHPDGLPKIFVQMFSFIKEKSGL